MLRVHVPTKEVLIDDAHAYLKYRELSDGLAAPPGEVVWADWGIHEYELATISQYQELSGDLVQLPSGAYTHEVVDKALSAVKAVRVLEIKGTFEAAPGLGCMVLSDAFRMDAKRDDVDNLRNLITYTEAVGGTDATEVTIRDFDNAYHTVTVAQLKQIIVEMIGNGLQLFQRKWTAEGLIAAAETVEAVIAVEFY